MESRRRRRQPVFRTGTWSHVVLEYVLLLAGSMLIALTFNLILNPNRIASGGVSGISTILQAKLGWEPALTQWGFNIPLFILGLIALGRKFGIKTAVGSVVLPLFVLLTRNLQPLTHNILLATIYGGIAIGIGLGLVFRGRGSTGGLDLAAQIIHKYSGLSLGMSVALLDGSVITAAGIFLSPEKALYALIGLFVTSKTIDVVQMGLSTSKAAYIITEKSAEMTKAILHDLDRGLTKLSGSGGFTGQERPVLMVVLSQREVSKLKTLVKAVDANAFMMISNANEVFGEGFKVHS